MYTKIIKPKCKYRNICKYYNDCSPIQHVEGGLNISNCWRKNTLDGIIESEDLNKLNTTNNDG